MLLPTVPQWSIRTSSKSFGALLLPLTLFPSIDEPEKCPLKEFLIKFSTLNGQRPLTLDFYTFCSSTGLDYNNVSSGTVPDPQDLERDIQLASTGLPSTLNEGTCPSKPFPKGTATHSKDSGGNKQPLDRDITFMTSNEGMAKTMSRPEGSLRDKDSRETYHPLIWNQYTLL
ncbi:hypothetical protein Tco_1162555, partial [Tanacetum coccineum]